MNVPFAISVCRLPPKKASQLVLEKKSGIFFDEIDPLDAISQTFYEQLFQTKVFLKLFITYTQFGFEFFCRKNIKAKAAHKMLIKWTIRNQSYERKLMIKIIN